MPRAPWFSMNSKTFFIIGISQKILSKRASAGIPELNRDRVLQNGDAPMTFNLIELMGPVGLVSVYKKTIINPQ